MLISNHVRLLSPLAEGGMGSIWIAEHVGLSTRVAVKFISEEISRDPASVKRFTQEASAAAQIRSQHVVQIFDHGVSEEGLPYIVMELLEGQDLGQRVAATGPMGLAELTQIMTQACRGLYGAHKMGIVHRDIKPENIFLSDSDGELLVKLLDFGIAKRTGEYAAGVTSTGTVVGTPSYMSPEQLLSAKGVDFRSDIWSLGVVVYFALTAKLPFEGETLGALAVAINTGRYPALTERRVDLPPSFDEWMACALAQEPGERFPSVKEMAAQLYSLAEGHSRSGANAYRAQQWTMPDPHADSGNPSDPTMSAPSGATPSQLEGSTLPMDSGAVPVQPNVGPHAHLAAAGTFPSRQPTFDGAAVTHSGHDGTARVKKIIGLSFVGLFFAGVGAAGVLYTRGTADLAPTPSASSETEGDEVSENDEEDAEALALKDTPDADPTAPIVAPTESAVPTAQAKPPAAPPAAAPPKAVPPPTPPTAVPTAPPTNQPPPITKPNPTVKDRGF